MYFRERRIELIGEKDLSTLNIIIFTKLLETIDKKLSRQLLQNKQSL